MMYLRESILTIPFRPPCSLVATVSRKLTVAYLCATAIKPSCMLRKTSEFLPSHSMLARYPLGHVAPWKPARSLHTSRSMPLCGVPKKTMPLVLLAISTFSRFGLGSPLPKLH